MEWAPEWAPNPIWTWCHIGSQDHDINDAGLNTEPATPTYQWRSGPVSTWTKLLSG